MATNEMMAVEFSFFGEVWTFFKKFYEANDSEEYWKTVVNESTAINEKYSNQLCRDLLIAVLKELNRKGAQKHEGT